MPRQISSDEFQQIEDVLLQHADGLSLVELQKEIRGSTSRRTVSRRVAALLAAGRIHRRGEARAVRYLYGPRSLRIGYAARTTGPSPPVLAIAQEISPPTQGQFETPEGSVAIGLSAVARSVLEYVSRPVAARTPRGYQRRLLDRYVPNRTAYLSETVQSYLHKLGKPIAAERAAGTFARDILGRFLIDLSWASSRLEGNTYSRLDTERLIQFGEQAEGKDAQETQMILNHKAAIELLVDEESDGIGMNRFTLFNLHALLSENLMHDPEACGRLRFRPVEIAGSVYTPTAVPQLIEEYFELFIRKAAAIRDPFEQAFFAMVHLPYLQPFEDVNKRVSRIAANIPLIRADVCPLSFVDVPARAYIAGTIGVYEMTRMELLRDVFVWAYERSCQRYVVIRDSVAEPDRFRMKYRQAMTEVIGLIVRGERAPAKRQIAAYAKGIVDARDVPRFTEMVMLELGRLNEGNIARHRIRLSEYRSWLDRRSAASRRTRRG